MEAVVDKAFGYVLNGDFLEIPEINDALVRDQTIRAGVENWEMFLKSRGHVVGVQDGDLVDLVSPFAPIMATYIHEIVQMLALPQGAEQSAPSLLSKPV